MENLTSLVYFEALYTYKKEEVLLLSAFLYSFGLNNRIQWNIKKVRRGTQLGGSVG